jgi:hypothetical protein
MSFQQNVLLKEKMVFAGNISTWLGVQFRSLRNWVMRSSPIQSNLINAAQELTDAAGFNAIRQVAEKSFLTIVSDSALLQSDR